MKKKIIYISFITLFVIVLSCLLIILYVKSNKNEEKDIIKDINIEENLHDENDVIDETEIKESINSESEQNNSVNTNTSSSDNISNNNPITVNPSNNQNTNTSSNAGSSSSSSAGSSSSSSAGSSSSSSAVSEPVDQFSSCRGKPLYSYESVEYSSLSSCVATANNFEDGRRRTCYEVVDCTGATIGYYLDF